MKAFELETRNRKVVQGIALVPNVGLKTQCIRLGRALHARWIKRNSNEQNSALYDEGYQRVLECGIEEFTTEGVTYHSMVDAQPDDNRALLRITTMPLKTKAVPDKGYTSPLFGDPLRGLTGYGTSGTKDHPGATWEEVLYVLKPVSLPDRILDAVLVHTQGSSNTEDTVVVYSEGEVLLLSYDEFLSHYVQTWILSASEEEFHRAFTLANQRNHREMAAFLRETYASFTRL